MGILLLLAAAQFCNILDFMIMMPMGHQLISLFQITPKAFSWLVSSYSISAGLSGFCMIFLADRFDRKNVMVVMYGGFLLGTLSCALARSYEALLISRFCTGIFGGVLGSIVLSIASDIVPISRRGRAMGIINTAFSFASVVGVPLGLYLADTVSWQAPFFFVIALASPVWICLWCFLPSVKDHLKGRGSTFSVLRGIRSDKSQRNALVLMVTLTFGHFIIIPFLSPSMVANVGFSQSQLTFIYLFGGMASIISSPIIGKLSDSYGKHFIFSVAAIVALIPILWITNMGPSPLWLALIGTSLLFVAGGGRFIPAMALSSGTVSPQARGTYMSLQACMQQVGMGVASLAAGLVVMEGPGGRLEGYHWLGYLSAAISVFCFFWIKGIQVSEKNHE